MRSDRYDFVLFIFGVISIALTAAADFWLNGIVAIGIVHSVAVLLAMTAGRLSITFALAMLATLSVVAVAALDTTGFSDPVAIANRALALPAIWASAALVFYLREKRQKGDSRQLNAEPNDIFREIFNQTFQFVAVLDLKGNIIEANETLRDYAGMTTGEIRSVPVWLLPIFHKDSAARARLQDAIAAAAEGDFLRDEFDVSGVGDQPTVIDLSLKPIRGEDGAIHRIILEARDITETHTQYEMLVQAQKMEAVGELTSGIAHDFNNLLMVIVGNLEMLEKSIDGNEDAQDRLDRAFKAAFRGQALTQQLLAFSRRQSLNPAVIDVNTLLRGMSQMYEALGDDIRIEFDLADDLPACEVDPTLLETALLNIAINARDAMADGGVLRFETAGISFDDTYRGEVADLPPGDYICLAVSDTGAGMPKDVLSQVFDPFFTTKPEGEGTGLGLSMVYGFVNQSGGDAKIYSETGEGTTIRLYLPASDRPLAEPPQARNGNGEQDVTDALEGKLVLLVDDDDDIRDIVETALKETGCHVETAENGDAAIGLIQGGKTYDLVFTDMVMDGSTGGTDVARTARAAQPDVPIIFCSGFPRRNLEGEEASIEGAIFLPKPFYQADLVAAVDRAFRRSKRYPAGLSENDERTE